MTKFEDIKLKRITYQNNGVELEGLVFIPEGKGPFPLVTFVHGHSHTKAGAWDGLMGGYLTLKSGFVGFYPSMLGYGLSGGQPDFCGPNTVQGIIDGVKIVLNEPYVDSGRSAIWGFSRGSTLASQVILKEPALFKAAVLQAGVYDMKVEYEWKDLIPGIKENIKKESGGTKKDLLDRSSILNMDKVTAKVLLIHGSDDKNVSVEQTILLDKKLTELGKEHQTIILNGFDHFLPPKVIRRQYVFPFFEEIFNKK